MDKLVSNLLIKKFDLWLWDWDDTLIDTTTYYVKDMEPESICKRTSLDLDNEVPNWRYFQILIPYLVKNGVRVGIVSFGTYKIIQAYMDLIFGLNQKFFNSNNIIALCRDSKGVPIEFYPNKNNFIQRVMNFYDLDNYQKVILFDDRMTNISDCIEIGVFGYKIIGKDDNLLNEYVKTGRKDQFYEDTLFSKTTVDNLECLLKDLKNEKPILTFSTTNSNNKKFYFNEQMGFLGFRKGNKFVKITNEEFKEKCLNDTIEETIIEYPDLFNISRIPENNNNQLVNTLRDYTFRKKNSNSNINSNNKNNLNFSQYMVNLNKINNNNNYNNNINNYNKNRNYLNEAFTNSLKYKQNNTYLGNLEKHKKIFLLVFILSLLVCLYFLKNK